MLEIMIIDNEGAFVGSMEAFGLKENTIEMGIRQLEFVGMVIPIS